MSTSYQDDHFYLARKAENLRVRARLFSVLRGLFIENGFLEVETPVRLPAPAPEEHIEAIPSGNWFLQTSPELCMKRLLAAGYPKIFQIGKCFRADEFGRRHLPEFSMLEWYVAGFDYLQLMNQCEALLVSALGGMGQNQTIAWQTRKIRITPPWERLTVDKAFLKYAPVSLHEAMRQDLFDEMLTKWVEPNLGMDRPTFLYDYPAKLAALAKINKDEPASAERFELYIGGMEIANGFSELTDADEQRRRFEEAQAARTKKNWSRYSMPEKFLTALAYMPPSAGIALGLDRLVMLLTNAGCIDDVVAFGPQSL